ncbi:MAG: carbon storage regulator [Gammaproteobacteria bacterium]|jgi:carbon storage regulator
MLVATRRPGESIVIELPTGERIEVAVLAVKGNQVRVGTDAPEHLPVMRSELLECAADRDEKASAT